MNNAGSDVDVMFSGNQPGYGWVAKIMTRTINFGAGTNLAQVRNRFER